MSSQQQVTHDDVSAAERAKFEMGQRLHTAAGIILRSKLASGEIKVVNGRYVGRCLQVTPLRKLRAKSSAK
ncbi:hypothetical protein [Pluralibacter gergoviae]|uniref:hypothetical protein n=1 Tax=Pluralibacter gergoviae TaxID=61647 RepID=UPI002914E2B1|nr:hypothetical protein [Pluralibacter gergoviae]MDU4002171.1 hypothetical protein [Pluralibacter gergoviae]